MSGKRGITTRIITAYRPYMSNDLKSTFQQQKHILDAKKLDTYPGQQILEDLGTEIQSWMAEGDQIIVMINLNDDVTSSLAATKLNSIGLQECITSRHIDETPLRTYIKGTKPMDGMFFPPCYI